MNEWVKRLGFVMICLSGSLIYALDISDAGRLHVDPNATVLNKLYGYHLYHHQIGYVDGVDQNGNDFNETAEEFRRAWLGVHGTLFKVLKFKAVSQLSNDRNYLEGQHRQWGHETFRNFNFQIDVKKLMHLDSVDSLVVGYGRRSMKLADEWQRSASHIMTLERSAFSNALWPNDSFSSHPVGTWVKWKDEGSVYDFGVFSGAYSDWLAGWNQSTVYFGSYHHDFSANSAWDEHGVWVSGYYQDSDTGDQVLANGDEWGSALVGVIGKDQWTLHMTLGLAGNGANSRAEREGLWGGGVVMPTYWVVPDKLKWVNRYALQLSEEAQGVRLNSRYARIGENNDDSININSGYGDAHHSFYSGLNYHFAGENLKILGGIQYDDLESNGQHIYKGWTTGFGFRSYF